MNWATATGTHLAAAAIGSGAPPFAVARFFLALLVIALGALAWAWALDRLVMRSRPAPTARALVELDGQLRKELRAGIAGASMAPGGPFMAGRFCPYFQRPSQPKRRRRARQVG